MAELAASSLTDRVAIITGATGGIGKAIVNRLLTKGARVCALARSSDRIDRLVHETGCSSERMRGYACDLLNDGEIERFCTTYGTQPLDVMVHAAGVIELQSFANAPLADFDRQFRINVRAPFRLTQALLPNLVKAGGQVVFINSTAALRASQSAPQYGATKHALRALADALRDEVNAHGVRVLSVFLGRTATQMQALVHAHEGRAYDPGKLMQPDDVAAVVISALEMPRTAEVTDVWIRPFVKS
jgi:NADP-dependent 3-hydroxy acid dehydrogenase YdfG